MTTRLAVLSLLCSSSIALAQGPTLSGTFQTVNAGTGDQIDPHVACDLASYTNDDGGRTIRYFDFTTDTDHLVPTAGAAHLSDVNGSRIVYTLVTAAGGSQIAIFDTSNSSTVTIPNGNRRVNAAIGGNLVAFEDRSYSTNTNESEVVAYDLASGNTIRLSNDALQDINPSVSPTGSAVVFQKCQTTGFNCEIYAAIQSGPTTFSTQQLTTIPGDKRNPDTNGSLVVYTNTNNGETDVYYQPLAGGAATQLSIPGIQRNPTISGDLIAFESEVTLAGAPEYDIFVYDVISGTLYQVTSTPGDETLNDVSVCNGEGRIVYSAPGDFGDYDVFAFTFAPPAPPPPSCDPQTAAEACENPGDRPLLAELSVTRTTGEPDSASATFASDDERGLVCVTNRGATSGAVSINGDRAVGPSAFKHGVDLIAVRVDDLELANQLEARIAGQAGTSYTVKVYGADPACSPPGGGGRGHDDGYGGGNDNRDCDVFGAVPGAQIVRTEVSTVPGLRLTSVGRTMQMNYDLNEALDTGAVGCSATSGMALSALAVLAVWLASRRRPAAVRARRS